ncbi:MAG TPA: hypothetical protein VGQ95_13025 [Chthoniobacterales bacterium]|nr:hypothetical protein [Chthoniobacterales bacterium]
MLLAAFTTTGGRQVFVKEVLGSAYDSQAEHFLRGNVDVDGEAIRHEAIVVDGKARMYFGPFPALLRIPLNYIYPAGRGSWSRLSGLCAGVIALVSFAALVADTLSLSSLSARARSWLGSACVTGFALGSPLLLLLGNLSVYNEAIVWGLAWALAALFFANRARTATGYRLTGSLLGFSFCAAGALLSRATFGLPFLLIAPVLFLQLPAKGRISWLTAIFLPLGAALAFYLLLSYARFGTWSGTSYTNYINPVHREFAKNYGVFSLSRVPYGFADYFSLRFPELQHDAPFLKAERHASPNPSAYSLPFSETYLSVPWCSGWLLFGAIFGVSALFRRGRSDWLDRAIAAALFGQFICILCFFALAQRYAADLYPFLIFCFCIFLRGGGRVLFRNCYLMSGLVALSIVVNSLATISWLIDIDQNVPAQTRASWKAFLGRTDEPTLRDGSR